jgi:hypothetical protein
MVCLYILLECYLSTVIYLNPEALRKILWDRISWTYLPTWLRTTVLLISASWVARIIGVSHRLFWVSFCKLQNSLISKGKRWPPFIFYDSPLISPFPPTKRRQAVQVAKPWACQISKVISKWDSFDVSNKILSCGLKHRPILLLMLSVNK